MDDYIIGAGALLTSGDNATITPAALHAQVDGGVASCARAIAVDFEGPRAGPLRRVLVMAAGWSGVQFQRDVTARLLEQGTCSFADVLSTLGRALGVREVHVFARWSPDDVMRAHVERSGCRIVAHPIEAIERAALISDQRFTRWPAACAA